MPLSGRTESQGPDFLGKYLCPGQPGLEEPGEVGTCHRRLGLVVLLTPNLGLGESTDGEYPQLVSAAGNVILREAVIVLVSVLMLLRIYLMIQKSVDSLESYVLSPPVEIPP